MIKVLNLYAGIGGNRKLWEDVEVTAVEIVPEIAKIYQDFFPKDKVVIADAHQYLLEHYKEFDFIWSSPPCQSHSSIRKAGVGKGQYAPFYPDMKLYEEIIFLKYYYKGKWVVENVKSYYEPLIKPFEYGRHYYWSNFIICDKSTPWKEHFDDIPNLIEVKGLDISKYHMMGKRKLLSNCVAPEQGLHIFKMAWKSKQVSLQDIGQALSQNIFNYQTNKEEVLNNSVQKKLIRRQMAYGNKL